MHHRIDSIQAIPPATRDRLARIGVNCTDDLLIRGRAPDGRDSLARLSGLPLPEIERLVAIADLARINGLSPDEAAALADRAGVRTASEFARLLGEPRGAGYTLRYAAQPPLQARAAELAARLGDDGPSAERLAEAAEEAFELVPRAVFPQPDDGAAFREKILAYNRESRRLSGRANWVLGPLVIGFCLVLFLATHIMLRRTLDQSAIDLAQFGPVADALYAHAERIIHLSEIAAVMAVALVLAAVAATWGFYSVLSRFVNPGLLFLLFDKPAYRDAYFRVAMLDLQRNWKDARRAHVILIVFALCLASIAIVELFRYPQRDEAAMMNIVKPMAAVGGALIALSAGAGFMRFYLREFRSKGSADADAGARFTLYMLAQVALIPIIVLILTHVTLPLAFAAHHTLYRAYVVPHYATEFAAEREALAALELTDPGLAAYRDSRVSRWVTLDQQIFDTNDYSGASGELLSEIVPFATNAIVWISLTGIVALFVVPYAALRGWRKSALYGAIILSAFFLEDWLAAAAPALFNVPERTVAYWLLVFIVLLASAFFFDFIYDNFTRRVRPCPACRLNIDPDMRFCPHCGLAQGTG